MKYLAAALCLGMCAGAQGATLYGVGPFPAATNATLYRVEDYATNPHAVEIGQVGTALVGDIAVDPTSGLGYAVLTTGSLFSINLATGAGFPVGAGAGINPNALTFSSDGTLYSWGGIAGAPPAYQDSKLYVIDKVNGGGDAVLDTGYLSAGDLAYDPQLNALFGSASTGDLIRIDLDDMSVTPVGMMGTNILGLDIDPDDGTLYALLGSTFSATAQLYTVDKSSGALTSIGAIAGADGVWGGWGMSFAAGGPAEPVLGDMNGDAILDAFDVPYFEFALAQPEAFLQAFPNFDLVVGGDFTNDGFFDAFDVGPFEAALANVGGTIPEPRALVVMGVVGFGLFYARRRGVA